MILRWILCAFLLTSCAPEGENELLKISKESVLHNNSSRIWLVNSVSQKGVNRAKLKMAEKDVMIFFKSGKVLIQPIATLGVYPEKYGELTISDDSKRLSINFIKDNWEFDIKQISEKKIVLKRNKNSDFKYDLELIAYPEGR